MNEYEAIFARKSVRKYNGELKLSEEELELIMDKLNGLTPLVDGIEVEFEIKPCKETNCKFNAQYCVVAYSQEKEHWKENVGYKLAQLDLFLPAINVGACWYGMGRVKEKYVNGKRYAIMYCFGKCGEQDFRSRKEEFTRKKTEEIWKGEFLGGVADAVRFAPSACNSQPWRVVYEDGGTVKVYREKNTDNILTRTLSRYFNGFDMGIFMYIFETVLKREGYEFSRKLYPEKDGNPVLAAEYTLKQ